MPDNRERFSELSNRLNVFLEKSRTSGLLLSPPDDLSIIPICQEIAKDNRCIPRDMRQSLRMDVLRVLLNCVHLHFFMAQASEVIVQLRLDTTIKRYIRCCNADSFAQFSISYLRALKLSAGVGLYFWLQEKEAEYMLGTVVVDGEIRILSNWAY